jgi:hypothetical protein
MRTKALLSLFVTLCVFGCKSTTGPNSSPDYLIVGNSFIYSNVSFDSIGNAGIEQYDTVTIISFDTVSGNTQLTLSDGAIEKLDPNGTISQYLGTLCTIYKIPATPGDTLMRIEDVPMKIHGVVGQGLFVLFGKATDTMIFVPAGVFSCSAYELDIVLMGKIETREMIFISPTAGIVERDYYNPMPLYLSIQKQLLRVEKK